ncbi:hypothetical protein PILCRDRAFT_827237 [Piloderma croceum F 1598]|uniref:Conserved oligomeric Golgi complex subunit 2 n=1 Tax=Piloderma croceum (strain F 1598) TaxID=765440 RepID=A0A0C3F677_PILCF|nr:hypothetical protein PILCRDRAFT_827237 [Piloderma croceum F 1598]
MAPLADPRDPFQLDRLAEELASRELSPHPDRSSAPHDLPVYVPLSHSNPYLAAPTFDVEDFLISRSHTSLPDLRSELRDYLGSLKEELVKLINDDYEAFISLSTDLRGEGTRLERLKYPLVMLKSELLVSKGELQVIQDAIQDKLRKRAILREEKALLHLLLKISESVTRLESLLLIAAPAQDASSSPELPSLKLPSHLNNAETDDIDDRARGNRAKHLARVATEYTQLLYHVSKARTAFCVYIDEIQWRIDRIQSTLSSDLDHLFASTLLTLISGPTKGKEKDKLTIITTEGEKAKLTADLTECLRTYDILGLWRDAEDVIRREVVRAFVKKTIYPGALTAPHSPVVPHTPLVTVSNSHSTGTNHATSGPLTASLNPPQTPYTPYTAFATKQNPFEFTQSSLLNPVHLLDESEDTLARVYNQLLRFVERDLRRIMEVAERVSLRGVRGVVGGRGLGKDMLTTPGSGKHAEKAGGKQDSLEGFEIMANVVWAEFGRAIMDEMGSVVFAAGSPGEFRKHHETTQAFIRSLEFLAPSIHAIEAMRSHSVYTAFERRWQLHVYFQLRWKEIVSKLEDALAATSIESSIGKDKEPFVTNQAATVWVAISSCWSAEVYIPELGHRFWKFTLQLLSRYKTWLDNSLPAFEAAPKVSAALAADRNTGTPSSLTRTSTPVPPSESASMESNAADDGLLRQFAAAMVDIKAINSRVLAFFREVIVVMLPEPSDLGDGDDMQVEDALRHQLSVLNALIPPMSNQITHILTRRSCDALQPVRSILSQFRAMSNKRTPTEPSYFVPSILRPVRNFFGSASNDGPGEPLKNDFMRPCATEIFESVCHRYIYYLTAMKKTEESLRRLKKGQKSTFSLFGGSNTAKDNDRRDEERTRTQMILDVNAFSKDAESLGVDVLASDVFQSLHTMVHADLIDDP